MPELSMPQLPMMSIADSLRRAHPRQYNFWMAYYRHIYVEKGSRQWQERDHLMKLYEPKPGEDKGRIKFWCIETRGEPPLQENASHDFKMTINLFSQSVPCRQWYSTFNWQGDEREHCHTVRWFPDEHDTADEQWMYRAGGPAKWIGWNNYKGQECKWAELFLLWQGSDAPEGM